MRIKKACIVVDLRTGEHVAHIPDLIAVFSAAGWKTDIALKEYGGETLKLARKAAKEGYDLVIGYGGDGTLNDVLNGIMDAGGKSVAADVPGGTYNVWAGAIGIPHDPVKAALAIVNSEAHRIDLGHVEVEGLALPENAGNQQQLITTGNKQKQPKQSSQARQHFLLHVGMGFDAAVMARISKPLKYHIGPGAFDLAALRSLPDQHPFTVEVAAINNGGFVETHWQGEVWEVLVSKAPYVGGMGNIDQDVRMDDGLLTVYLLTATNAVRTLEQAASILLQHKFDEGTTTSLRGAHFSIRVPASIGLQVDGSVVHLEDLLRKSECAALQQADNAEQVMVTYRFDAEPAAVDIAVPRGYDGPLFEKPARGNGQRSWQQQASGARVTAQQQVPGNKQQRNAIQHEPEYQVAVVGVAPYPGKKHIAIIAGRHRKQQTGETQIVAVRVSPKTLVYNDEGRQSTPVSLLELQEGAQISVQGQKSKRGVIRASLVKLA